MHEIQIKVRFFETDALGHVNNASYFVYLEEARIEFLDSLDQDMDMRNWQFILASVKCDFIQQAYFKQVLTVKTYTKKIGNKSFQLEHEIIDSKTKSVIARGVATMVCFDFEKQETIPISADLRKKLENELIHH